ncbi:MAG: hypothetical protein K2N57_01915 [Clostridia bacterium]|nr:hypothetical protein [Clostridia bacterium]
MVNKTDTFPRELDFIDEKYIEETFSDDQFKNVSDSIFTGLAMDSDEHLSSIWSTLLPDNNMPANMQTESSIHNQARTFKTDNTKSALRYVSREYHSPLCESYYNEIKEYYGSVDTINEERNTFIATLSFKSDPENKISVEFNFDDVQYESEKSLIKIGAPLVWVIGQETGLVLRENRVKQGPRINISIFRFRRTKCLSSKQVQAAKEKANEWTRLFIGYKSEN